MSTLIPIIRPLQNVSFDVICTKFASNIKGTKPVYADYRIDIYSSENSKWQLVDSLQFNNQNFITIQPTSYLNVGEDICVGVPRYIHEPYENLITYLPLPFSKSVDKSPVPDRYLFQATTLAAVSSFQADYPYALSKLRRSSCVSTISPLRYGHTEQCFAIFISICADASNHHRSIFQCIDHKGSLLTDQKSIMSNSCAYLDLTSLASNNEAIISSPTLAGVPLFLSLMRKGNDLYPSLEHSHPPHEWFWYPFKHYTKLAKELLTKSI